MIFVANALAALLIIVKNVVQVWKVSLKKTMIFGVVRTVRPLRQNRKKRSTRDLIEYLHMNQ